VTIRLVSTGSASVCVGDDDSLSVLEPGDGVGPVDDFGLGMVGRPFRVRNMTASVFDNGTAELVRSSHDWYSPRHRYL
jgi:hypothetical protein